PVLLLGHWLEHGLQPGAHRYLGRAQRSARALAGADHRPELRRATAWLALGTQRATSDSRGSEQGRGKSRHAERPISAQVGGSAHHALSVHLLANPIQVLAVLFCLLQQLM